jgi:hypothetical protein
MREMSYGTWQQLVTWWHGVQMFYKHVLTGSLAYIFLKLDIQLLLLQTGQSKACKRMTAVDHKKTRMATCMNKANNNCSHSPGVGLHCPLVQQMPSQQSSS